MKALLYSDFTTIRKAVKQYLLTIAFVCVVTVFASISNRDIDAGGLAQIIQSIVMLVSPFMFAFYTFFQLFGQDERPGWESVKLSLPVTRTEVVVARYLVMVIMFAMILAASTALGGVVAALITQVKFGAVTLIARDELLVALLIALAVTLIYLGIEIPIFFKLGVAKARLFIFIPYLAFMLATLDPVQDLIKVIGAQVMRLVEAVGSPVPLAAGLVVLAVVLYAISLSISTRVYAAREF